MNEKGLPGEVLTTAATEVLTAAADLVFLTAAVIAAAAIKGMEK